MRKLRALSAAVVAAVSVFGAGQAQAITGNYQKDFVHDYVALLVFDQAPDPETGDTFGHRCSGTLISPTVIVTAGHCTEGFDRGRAYFEQAAAPNYDPEAFGGLGGDVTTGYPYLNGVSFSRADNYGSHDSVGRPDVRDAGVVVLDTAYTPPSGQFAALPEVGAVDAYAASARSKQGLRFVSSGYGLSDMQPSMVAFRERLMAWGYLVENTSGLTTYNLKTTANPAQGKGGSCNGDSGGPVFFEGSRTIAAVVSFGMNAQCKGLDFSYRLDRPEVLAWVLDPNRVDAG